MGIIMIPQQMKMNLYMMLGSMMLPVGVGAFVVGALVGALYGAWAGWRPQPKGYSLESLR